MTHLNKLLFLLSAVFFVCGCSGIGRGLVDAGGAAGGAYIGNSLGGGSAVATAAGAAGGVLVAEGAQGLYRSRREEAYRRGYQAGRANATKQRYWDLQEQQRYPIDP